MDSEPAGGMKNSQWWAGVIIFATTNVGFLKLFDLCASETDLKVVLTKMLIFYGVAGLFRLILRKVLKLKDFPQFFWEGMPPPQPQN
jgi:hypothetical protein